MNWSDVRAWLSAAIDKATASLSSKQQLQAQVDALTAQVADLQAQLAAASAAPADVVTLINQLDEKLTSLAG